MLTQATGEAVVADTVATGDGHEEEAEHDVQRAMLRQVFAEHDVNGDGLLDHASPSPAVHPSAVHPSRLPPKSV